MPSIKQRQRIIAQNFITASGMYRDLYIPWQDVYLASASIANMSASLQIVQVGGSQTALRLATVVAASPITLVVPVPQDIALRGATPAAGSGTVYLDWTDVTTANTCAVIGASLYHMPPGSAIGDAGTSTLGAAASTGYSACGATACELNATCLMDFNAPVNRTGLWALRLYYSGASADSATSNFALYGLRLRYLSDRIGS